MARLCERPDCSEPASVAYGMRPEDLVFWLDELRDPDEWHGVLCARHADSMTVPRNWTLDDLRDPDLHLFRPPAPDPRVVRRRRARVAGPASFDQLELDAGQLGLPDGGPDGDADSVDNVDSVENWWPDFDTADDLDGLLSARSPLLARAFRGGARER